MSRYLTTGALFIDQFPAWEADGVSKRSGLTVAGGDLSVIVWYNGAVSAVVPTITEIGSSGEYKLSFTPDAPGFWAAEVAIVFNLERWYTDADVVPEVLRLEFMASAADDNLQAVFALWIEQDGQRVATLDSMAAQIKDSDGALVVDLGSDSSPTADGVFRFATASSNLDHQKAYTISVQATEGLDTWYGNIGFAKA